MEIKKVAERLLPINGANLDELFKVAPVHPRRILLAPSKEKFWEGVALPEVVVGTYKQVLLPYGGVALGGICVYHNRRHCLGVNSEGYVVSTYTEGNASSWKYLKLGGSQLFIFINQPGA